MKSTKTNRKIVSVILAAGKGSRMESPNLHKVCFPLEGRPVITRAIETYHRCGIGPHFVVVGSMADQVMQSASVSPGDTIFCYQTDQRGTGNAAKAAAQVLSAMGYEDDVLVVAGDKVIEDKILEELIQGFHENESDLSFIVGDVNDFPSSGRIVYDNDSHPLGIVEVFDIAKMQLLLTLRRITNERIIPSEEAENLALSYIKQEKKAAMALGPIWDSIKSDNPLTKELIDRNFDESDFYLRINGKNLPPEKLEGVRHANLSVYLFRANAFYDALNQLSSDNAQQEEYLTDTIGILAAGGSKLNALPVEYPEQVMAFNTPKELADIEKYLLSKKTEIHETAKSVRLAGEWLSCFEKADLGAIRRLSAIYGIGHPNVEIKRRLLVSMLKRYIKLYGDGEVIITRAPGRVNIMGRHVDHQGGHGNMIAIDKDFYLIAGIRGDRLVNLHHLSPNQFPERAFSIDELLADYDGGDWLDFCNSKSVKDKVAMAYGDWSQYIKAAVARFQAQHSHRNFKGMNILAAGSIPIAAGLSSSSAVVVATAESLVGINNLQVSSEQFVEFCGEGEWYVGTRGGAGDHAAMKFAQRGQVVQVGFFPFGVTDTVNFPEDYLFVVCNSHEKARKTTGAKDVFNHRVACYNIGRELLKRKFPKFAPAIQHLRDFNTRNLGVEYAELLDMLKTLPESMTRKEVEAKIPPELAERYLGTHSQTFGSYPIRSVALYGLAECERSWSCLDLLRKGEIIQLGRWMNISHHGDRVVKWDKEGNSLPFAVEYTDKVMDDLIAKADNSEAALPILQGAYSCSIPQIDKMADIALSVHGVVGAQILGAGLGGCILILLHKDAYQPLEKAMLRGYYDPSDYEPDMFSCYPIAGSGPLIF